jgi:peptidoglycan/xylan/chitin deacetylase (PgdA/CDA1 family)
VLVTVNCDVDLFWMRLDPSVAERPKIRTIGEYGVRRGARRVLDALAAVSVPASWFVPGWVASTYPDLVEAVAAEGHELGARGVALERLEQLPADQHRRVLAEARDALDRITGRPPVGFRPFDEISELTVPQLIDAGFTWSSMTRGEDRPLLLEGRRDQRSIVDVPYHWQHQDLPCFLYNYYAPAFPVGQSRIAEYGRVLADWKAEFDGYRELGLCFVLTIEPQVSGTPGRIALFEQLLAHMTGAGDVWFATGRQVEQWWRERGAANHEPAAERIRKSTACAPLGSP